MKKIISIGLIVLCLGLGGFVLMQKREKNIFDEMYQEEQTAIKSNQKIGFAAVPQIEQQSYKDVGPDFPILRSYKKQYLPENIDSVTVSFDFETKEIGFSLSKELTDSLILNVSYHYYVQKKELIEKVRIVQSQLNSDGNYPEDIENPKKVTDYLEKYKISITDLKEETDKVFNQLIVSDWLNVNQSNYSLDDLGDVKYIQASIFE
ncbi:TipC family immunity protein [Enterococcus sp. BWM-S5]|uniref:TipC family immunity protein n=1 Tax=Enterococcus larvae TaxID=2794352 RepID=A0ABS4CJ88_9ENTE|nr:TipC family immunity protein [Enterococcus larvae]MBP1046680.1 TipC family immunity protein [Enterococcus larvae]